MDVTSQGPYSFESLPPFTVMSKHFQVLGFCGESGLAVGRHLWLLIVIFSASLIHGLAAHLGFFGFFFYKKEKKKKIPKLNLLVFYKINMLSLRICCEINTTIIGKNTIFLNKFFSFVYKSKHLHSKEEPHTHFTQLYSSAYQCRERNVLSVRPPRWATDNRTSKGLCLWLLKNNLSVLLDCYTEVNQLLQDTFQPTFQTTNTRDCNRDSTG